MMAVRANLATSPATNRRLLSLGLVAIVLICSVLVRQFVDELRDMQSQTRSSQEQLDIQQQQIEELRKRIPQSVTPDQLLARERELLTIAAVLIERRVFPWSQLLHDLETHMDKDVRMTRVNVGLEDFARVDPSQPGTAPMEISMVLVGKQLDNVLETMETLRATGRFSSPRLQKQSPIEGTQEVEFELEMTYRP
jgi:hypothetical protein